MQRPPDRPVRPAPPVLWVAVLVTGAMVLLGGVLSVVTAGSTGEYVWAGIMLLVGAALLALGTSGLRQRARRPT